MICTIPVVIDVVPAYVLAVVKINLPVPVPSLVRLLVVPLVPEIILVMFIPPVPFTPNVNPPVLVIPAVPIVSKLAPSLLILEAAFVVIYPDKVVVPLVLGIHIAPFKLLTPKLFKKKGSAKL